jgi:hypothetical protein
MKETPPMQTTGQLRAALAKAAQDVLSGKLDIEKATMLHKLSKNISESLYSETKIAMFRKDSGLKPERFGMLLLGPPDAA